MANAGPGGQNTPAVEAATVAAGATDSAPARRPNGFEVGAGGREPARRSRVLAAIDTVDTTRVLQAADVLAGLLGAASGGSESSPVCGRAEASVRSTTESSPPCPLGR